MSSNVKKAIIPAAGMGTRFLPITKSIPKEMLPIVDKPAIHYIIDEAIKSGIEEILVIVSNSKNSIIDYFDTSVELENILLKKSKIKEKQEIENISNMVNLYFLRQKKPLGLGHAISIAKSFVKNEPFAILLGDDIIDKNNGKFALKQCIDEYEKFRCSIVGVQFVNDENISKYGVIDIKDKKDDNAYEIKNIIEKPPLGKNPSNYAVMGRYVLTPSIFNELEKIKPDKSGEIQLTEAIANLLKNEKVIAKLFTGKRYDLGSKFGFLKANINFGLKHNDTKIELNKYMKSMCLNKLK
ncbi:UTP--glucose-1-phosphate uridylyltransferase GalU [Malacoplasma iowae]|uniref:UTP--glucose-1-phosphate uridylyltransferase n=1 Tax=Malacoplasma iowae 695 TaxID=1048830 RepID=A0A6P1LC46_MALIO|nr:UTP--glucose-1-phosphate uridylyltransferase GalU [Malacoplasma iowae]VEU62436.1 UTP-glucose-1-phosphate uridylyltransferase [Mycoplasmopsis fermentans]EGZ31428.1 UTP-glucose-1-phosphate uridylyltransferase [Malacoplasma iowae 695]QHG89757.1 UTP--glucose-1-phosphate uridylyltransferase GalU [Malacoplasma iowae 695]WPL35443.1 UTP--glucose-1-phosphate uridylyltransferase GalU [Malacoplasma iowae]WPL39158.1 UTP--glucose-1-phosphate uridylyltransferase GalU [Malacoplasma iowae]